MIYTKSFKSVVKLVTIATIWSFLSHDVVMAQGGAPSWKAPTLISPLEPSSANSKTPQVSEQLGVKRSEHLNGDTNELIINIQDAHTSIGSQKTTAKILSELVSQFHLDLIGIEGTVGAVDTGLVASFPDQKVRESVAESLLRDTRIGGAEFFKIISQNDVELIGVEDASLYKSNIRSYQRLILDENRIRAALTGLKGVLIQLEAKIYSDRIRAFNEKRLSHEAGDLKFVEYWAFLKGLVAEAGISADDRPNLNVLIRTAELEAEIDFDQAGRQRDRLVSELKKKLSGTDLAALSEKAIQFKSGELSQGKFNAELIERARVAGVDPVAYKDFILFTEYVELYEGIDFLRVFEEISGLESDLQSALLKKPEERALAALNHTVEIFGKLIEVKLSSADERYFREHREEFRIPQLRAAVEALAAAQGVDASAVNWRLLGSKIPDSDKFYQLAKERNETMLTNLMDRMRAHGKKAAAIVTGGFHTEGISELMRDRRVSHVVYMPKFDGKEGERPYFTVITQKGSFMDASIRRDAQLEAMALVFASAMKSGMKFDQARELWIDSYKKDLATNGTVLNEADFTDEALAAALDQADQAIKFTVSFDKQGVPHASSEKVPIAEFKQARELGELTSAETLASFRKMAVEAEKGVYGTRKKVDADASSAAPGSALAATDPASLIAGARMATGSREGIFFKIILPLISLIKRTPAAETPESQAARDKAAMSRRTFLGIGAFAAATAALPGLGRSAEPVNPADQIAALEPIVEKDYSDYDLDRIEAELKRLDVEIKFGSFGLGDKTTKAGVERPLISDVESVYSFRDLPKEQQDTIRAATKSEPDPNAFFMRQAPRAAGKDIDPRLMNFYPVRLNYKGLDMLARAIRAKKTYTNVSQSEVADLLTAIDSQAKLLKERTAQNVQNYQNALAHWKSLRDKKAQAWVDAPERTKRLTDYLSRSTEASAVMIQKIEGALVAHENAKIGMASTPAMFGEYRELGDRKAGTYYDFTKKGELESVPHSLDALPQTMLVLDPNINYDPSRPVEVNPRSLLDAGVGIVTPEGTLAPSSNWRVSPRLMQTGVHKSDQGYELNHFASMVLNPLTYEIEEQSSIGGIDPATGIVKYTENDMPDHHRAIAEGSVAGGELVPRVMAVEVNPVTGKVLKRYTKPSEMQKAMQHTLPVYRIDDDTLWNQLESYTFEDKLKAVKNSFPLISDEEAEERAGYYLKTFTTKDGQRFANWAPFMHIDTIDLDKKSPNFGKTRYQLVGLFNPASQTKENPMGNRVEYGSTPAVLEAPDQSVFRRLIPAGDIWPLVEFTFHMNPEFGSMTRESKIMLERANTTLLVEGGAWLRDPLKPFRLLPFNGESAGVLKPGRRVDGRWIPAQWVSAKDYYKSKSAAVFAWLRRNKGEVSQRKGWNRDKVAAAVSGIKNGMIVDTEMLESGNELSQYPTEHLVTGAKPAWKEAYQQLMSIVPDADQLSEQEKRDVLMLLLKKLRPAEPDENEGAKKAAPAAPVLAQGARMSAKTTLEKTSNPIDIAYVATESGFKGQPKVGGQFDVMEGLPLAMAERGHNITVISPQFNDIDPGAITETTTIEVPYGRGEGGTSGVMKMTVNKVIMEKNGAKITYLFLKDPDGVFFKRIYNNTDGVEGYFEAQILPRAAIQLVLKGYLSPDALHLNDWQTALAAAYIRETDLKERPELNRIKLLYSSHNMAYQGAFNGYLRVGSDFRDGALGRKLVRDGAIDPFQDLEQKVDTGHFATGSQHILHLVNDSDPSNNLLGLPGQLIADPHQGIEYNRGQDVGGNAPVPTGWKVAFGKAFRYSDKLVAVSEGNLGELQADPSAGGKAFGMEGLVGELAAAGKVAAVFNGGAGSPSEDPALQPGNEHGYSADVVTNRPQNKRALFHEIAKIGRGELPGVQFHGSLPTEDDWMNEFIIGGVARITSQKGFDDIGEALMKKLQNMRLPDGRKPRLVILGKALDSPEDSDPDGVKTQKRLIELANKYPDVFTMLVGYNQALSKHIFASIDTFMMNSYFEPAGITQQIANEYGAPVIAPLTGGLHDFFHKWNGQGFTYKPYHPWVSTQDRLQSMYGAIQQAFDMYTQRPEEWRKKVALSAQYDGSWESRVMAYEHNVYLTGLAESSVEHPDFHYQVNSLADLDRLPVYYPNLPPSFDMPAEVRKSIPQTTGNYFEFKDPKSPEGEAMVRDFVTYLSGPYTPDLLLQQKIISTLNHAQAWNTWPVEAIQSIYHQVIQSSIRDIVEFRDMRRVEAARRRIYDMAYMAYDSNYYRRRPSLDQPQDPSAPRWLAIHDDLIRSMHEALRPGETVAPQGRQLLEALIEVSSNKHTLDQYAVHRQHSPQRDFDSTVAKGLDVASIPAGSERTDKLFFSNGPERLDSIYSVPTLRHPEVIFRVRIDAGVELGRQPYLVKSGNVGVEFGDDDGDFNAFNNVPVDAIEVMHPLYPWIGIPLSLFKGYDDLIKFYDSLNTQRLPQAGARMAGAISDQNRTWLFNTMKDWLVGRTDRPIGEMLDELDRHVISNALPNRSGAYFAAEEISGITPEARKTNYVSFLGGLEQLGLVRRDGGQYFSNVAGARMAQETSEEQADTFLLQKESFRDLIKQFLSVRVNQWLTGIGISLPFVSAGASFLMGGGVPLLPMAILGVVIAAPILIAVFFIWKSEHNDARKELQHDMQSAGLFNDRWARTALIGVPDGVDPVSFKRHVEAALRAPLNVVVVSAEEFRSARADLNPDRNFVMDGNFDGKALSGTALSEVMKWNEDYTGELVALYSNLRSEEARNGLALSNLPDVGAMDHYVSMLLAAAPHRKRDIALSDASNAGLKNGRLQPMTITWDALLLQDAAARRLESRQYAQLGVVRTVVYPVNVDSGQLTELQRELPEITFKSVAEDKYSSGDFLDALYPSFGQLTPEDRSLMVVVSAAGQQVVGEGIKRLEVSQNGSDGNSAAFVTKAAIEVAFFDGTEAASDAKLMGIEWVLSPDGQRIYRYVKKMEPFLAEYIRSIMNSVAQTSTSA